jgi:hypothetical protein
MSPITVYLPEPLVRELKERARRARVSVSAYLTALVRRETSPPTWSDTFLASFGGWKGADIERPEPLPLERRAKLK